VPLSASRCPEPLAAFGYLSDGTRRALADGAGRKLEVISV
jgi:hypothetical protein